MYSIRKCRSDVPPTLTFFYYVSLPLEEECCKLKQTSPRVSILLSFAALMKELNHLLSDQKERRGHRRIMRSFCCRRIPKRNIVLGLLYTSSLGIKWC